MKIAIFTDTYLPEINGIVTSIDNFSKNLAKRGHQIYIFCPKYPGKRAPHPDGITVFRSPAFSFATNKATHIALPSLFRIMRLMRKIKPDVIHVQTPMSMGVLGVMMSKMYSIPNVQTYHTYIPDFMVYLSPKKLLGIEGFYEQVRDSKLARNIMASDTFRAINLLKERGDDGFDSFKEALGVKGRAKRTDLSERFAWDFTRFLYGKADLVLAPSQTLCNSLISHRVQGQIEAQSNGVEYDYFLKKKNYHIHGKIIHFGRLGLEKDVDIVVKAFSNCLKRYPNLTLDIAGDGPARPKVEQLVKKLKIEDRVRFLGFVPRTFFKTHLRSYDFFVTASAIETQGLVILEAMSAGLPAVGVKKLAAPEVIKNGQTGYLAKPKDAKSFSDKMMLLLTSRKKNQRLGEGAREMAFSHNLFSQVEKLENYYQEVIFKHLNKEELERFEQ